MAVLAFNPQGHLIQALFTAPHGTFSTGALALFSAVYYFLAALTYGAFIPSGLFTVSEQPAAFIKRQKVICV